jgi:hypothetical protein
MLSSTDIKTEAQQQQQNSMDEDEGGVDPLDMPAAPGLLGPVQEVPEDLSLKKELASSSSSPHHHQQPFSKTNVSRNSSSPSSEG